MIRFGTVHASKALGALAMVGLLNGCSMVSSMTAKPGEHAFITYWGPAKKTDKLRLAVKDNIDMKGVVTTAGSAYFEKANPPAKSDAPLLAGARRSGVQIVGKTNLSEFAVAPSGYNEHFGTPASPLSGWFRHLIPGGSSCGSAVSVALGMADVSFGTDTAGSVRVPAACCGVVGLKTTHGLVPLRGVYPIEAKHLDTVGPIARNIEDTVKGMDLLQSGFAGRYAAAKGAKPSAQGIRVGRLRLPGTDDAIDRAVDNALVKAGFQVVPLGEDFVKAWEQATEDGNTIAAAGVWMSYQKYRNKIGIAGRTKSAILLGQIVYPKKYYEALGRRPQWQRTLQRTFAKVDVIAVPTLKTTPPILPADLKIGFLEARMLGLQNTVAVNVAGNPAVAVPVPLRKGNVRKTSLQFIGPPRSEAQLLNAGRLVEEAVAKKKG
jgi:Asp-tRNA(Asn)/Glu-tRNA(Gln) amidotransferase A subunit family amidase